MIFGKKKKLLNKRLCLDFLHERVWNISVFKKKWAKYDKKIYIGLDEEYPLLLSDFN